MPIRRVLLIAVGALLAGCGSTTHTTPTTIPPPAALTRWPSAADYGTIKTAVAARDDALFRQTDWRHRSFLATLAMRTLLTVRVGPGSCAQYVVVLYTTLQSLRDAYAGEDWRPLVQFVHHQPTLASVCRRPSSQLTV
jgi:type IV pilus biogenesis protein CpaD/CtpE